MSEKIKAPRIRIDPTMKEGEWKLEQDKGEKMDLENSAFVYDWQMAEGKTRLQMLVAEAIASERRRLIERFRPVVKTAIELKESGYDEMEMKRFEKELALYCEFEKEIEGEGV